MLGLFVFSVINRTLTRTTGSVTCVRDHGCACACVPHGGLGTPTASQHNSEKNTIFFRVFQTVFEPNSLMMMMMMMLMMMMMMMMMTMMMMMVVVVVVAVIVVLLLLLVVLVVVRHHHHHHRRRRRHHHHCSIVTVVLHFFVCTMALVWPSRLTGRGEKPMIYIYRSLSVLPPW